MQMHACAANFPLPTYFAWAVKSMLIAHRDLFAVIGACMHVPSVRVSELMLEDCNRRFAVVLA